MLIKTKVTRLFKESRFAEGEGCLANTTTTVKVTTYAHFPAESSLRCRYRDDTRGAKFRSPRDLTLHYFAGALTPVAPESLCTQHLTQNALCNRSKGTQTTITEKEALRDQRARLYIVAEISRFQYKKHRRLPDKRPGWTRSGLFSFNRAAGDSCLRLSGETVMSRITYSLGRARNPEAAVSRPSYTALPGVRALR